MNKMVDSVLNGVLTVSSLEIIFFKCGCFSLITREKFCSRDDIGMKYRRGKKKIRKNREDDLFTNNRACERVALCE